MTASGQRQVIVMSELINAASVFLAVLAALEVHAVLRRERRRPKATAVAGFNPRPCNVNPPAPPMRPPYPVSPAEAATKHPARLEQLARDLLDPDAYGHTVGPEVRQAARRALGLPIFKPTKP